MLAELARHAVEADERHDVVRTHRGNQSIQRALASGVPRETGATTHLDGFERRLLFKQIDDEFPEMLDDARSPDPSRLAEGVIIRRRGDGAFDGYALDRSP